MKNAAYYIEQTSNNGVTYFQVIRANDAAILYANQSLSKVADRLFKPVWKDGSPVIL